MKFLLFAISAFAISSVALAQSPAEPASPTTTLAPVAAPTPATTTTETIAPAPSATAADSAAPATEAEKAPQDAATSKIQIALSRLPTEKAKIFDMTLRRNLEKNKERQQQVRVLYKEIRDNFNGGEFKKSDFLIKSQLARDLQTQIRASLDEDLAEIADKYTQQERQIIFEALPARYTREMLAKESSPQ